jgi:hypothetical protein
MLCYSLSTDIGTNSATIPNEPSIQFPSIMQHGSASGTVHACMGEGQKANETQWKRQYQYVLPKMQHEKRARLVIQRRAERIFCVVLS